jgi:capsular polysaccharide biosynthesis protein
MSQQELDLRRSVQIVRRHKVLVGVMTALGLLIGAAYGLFNPPVLTGSALVVIPLSAANSQVPQNETISPYTQTQMLVVRSDVVLSAALPRVRPAMSLDELRNDVQVSSPTSYLILVSAKNKVAADAEATANAVADSYASYVNSTSNPAVHVAARVLDPATSASGRKSLESLLLFAPIGAVAGALIGVIIALAIARSDRRLRERDELANSIGVPVLASVPVTRPTDAAGWTRLLEEYDPGALDGWHLRQALQHLGMLGTNPNNGSSRSSSVAVLSLSSDPAALALGPQLAAFAASQGIPTTLVIGPQQDENATATLRTACAGPSSALSKRAGYLLVAVSDSSNVDAQSHGALTVVVAVVDSKTPQVSETMRTAATVLGVSAGAATAEQLARAAVSAAADGREIVGLLVANPEAEDRTTGRVPQIARPRQRRLPTRLKGMTTEIRR